MRGFLRQLLIMALVAQPFAGLAAVDACPMAGAAETPSHHAMMDHDTPGDAHAMACCDEPAKSCVEQDCHLLSTTSGAMLAAHISAPPIASAQRLLGLDDGPVPGGHRQRLIRPPISS